MHEQLMIESVADIPRRWVSQAWKMVSSKFSSQMRLISAILSFLFSETSDVPEHENAKHIQRLY